MATSVSICPSLVRPVVAAANEMTRGNGAPSRMRRDARVMLASGKHRPPSGSLTGRGIDGRFEQPSMRHNGVNV